MGGTDAGGFSSSDRALMVVSDAMVHGSTRMQKYGFLLAKQYKKETGRISEAMQSPGFYTGMSKFVMILMLYGCQAPQPRPLAPPGAGYAQSCGGGRAAGSGTEKYFDRGRAYYPR